MQRLSGLDICHPASLSRIPRKLSSPSLKIKNWCTPFFAIYFRVANGCRIERTPICQRGPPFSASGVHIYNNFHKRRRLLFSLNNCEYECTMVSLENTLQSGCKCKRVCVELGNTSPPQRSKWMMIVCIRTFWDSTIGELSVCKYVWIHIVQQRHIEP